MTTLHLVSVPHGSQRNRMYHGGNGNGHMRGPQPPSSRPPDRPTYQSRYEDAAIELPSERARPSNELLARFRSRELAGHRRVAASLAWSCDGRQLATGSHRTPPTPLRPRASRGRPWRVAHRLSVSGNVMFVYRGDLRCLGDLAQHRKQGWTSSSTRKRS